MTFQVKKYLKILTALISIAVISVLTWINLLPTKTEEQLNAKIMLTVILTILLVIYPIVKIFKEKKIGYSNGTWNIINFNSNVKCDLTENQIIEIHFLKMNLPIPILSHRLIKIKIIDQRTISFHSREINDFQKLTELLKKDFGMKITKQEF